MKKIFLLLTLLLPSLNLLAMANDDWKRVLSSKTLSPDEWSNGKYAALSGLPLKEIYLKGENLADALFESTDLTGANLSWANLARVNFRDAILRNAVFNKSDLKNADFRGADLAGADFRGAHLEGAQLKGTTTRGFMLQKPRFDGATCDEKTTLPKPYVCTGGTVTDGKITVDKTAKPSKL